MHRTHRGAVFIFAEMRLGMRDTLKVCNSLAIHRTPLGLQPIQCARFARIRVFTGHNAANRALRRTDCPTGKTRALYPNSLFGKCQIATRKWKSYSAHE